MLELKEEYDFGMSPEGIEVLKQFAGSGKATALAKKLALEGVAWNRVGSLYEAAKQSFASRIARVERWQRTQYFAANS